MGPNKLSLNFSYGIHSYERAGTVVVVVQGVDFQAKEPFLSDNHNIVLNNSSSREPYTTIRQHIFLAATIIIIIPSLLCFTLTNQHYTAKMQRSRKPIFFSSDLLRPRVGRRFRVGLADILVAILI